jgi:hypothetical protein
MDETPDATMKVDEEENKRREEEKMEEKRRKESEPPQERAGFRVYKRKDCTETRSEGKPPK